MISPRPYHCEQDLESMKAVLLEGRKAGGPTYYVHVGDLDWWVHYLNSGDDLSQVIFLWECKPADTTVVGWSLLSPRFCAFDVFVLPTARNTELAKHIWVWTEEQMCRMVREQGGKSVHTMWVGERDAYLMALLEQRGFTRSDYHLLNMTRSLNESIPEPPLPPGYRVRQVAGEEEVKQRAAVAHAAFMPRKPFEAYKQDYLAFMRSSAYTPELDLVTVDPDGRFGSFCVCWLDFVNKVGLFEPVGTSPEFRRKGLGKVVLLEGLRRMQARGMRTAMVCVEYDNSAAQQLYASIGLRTERKILTYTKDVKDVNPRDGR